MAGLGGTVCFLLTHENSLPPVRTCQCKRLSIFVTPPKVAVPTSKTQMKSMRTLWYVFAMSENRRQYSRHIDIRRYFARELVKAVFVKLISLRTHEWLPMPSARVCPRPPSSARATTVWWLAKRLLLYVFTLEMCLVCTSIPFFMISPVWCLLDCPMCSISAHIVREEERHIIHRPLGNERVRERTA